MCSHETKRICLEEAKPKQCLYIAGENLLRQNLRFFFFFFSSSYSSCSPGLLLLLLSHLLLPSFHNNVFQITIKVIHDKYNGKLILSYLFPSHVPFFRFLFSFFYLNRFNFTFFVCIFLKNFEIPLFALYHPYHYIITDVYQGPTLKCTK